MTERKKLDEPAAILSAKGLRILIEALLGRAETASVVENDEECEVNALIRDYLQYRKEVTAEESFYNILPSIRQLQIF